MASATYTDARRLASGLVGEGASAEIQAATVATVTALAPSEARIVVLGAPPTVVPMQECVTRVSTPSNCISQTTTNWKISRTAEQSASAASGAEYVDTQLWFCNEGGSCPGFVGTTPVRADFGHLTAKYSERLAPLLASIAP
jgi:hypothetical protein